ncbi:MAG: hypothetical protein OEM38_08975, partial [Gammaproteobacteria bacterium]|nr:hypothetical protein [Gammaproteobacteria bacterium]
MMYYIQRLHQNGKFLSIILVFISLLLNGCFVEEDSNSPGEPISNELTETRIVTAKSTITNAQINLYELDGRGRKILTSLIQESSDAEGVWSTSGLISNKYYLVEITNGNYFDNSDTETDLTKKRNILLTTGQAIYSILEPGKNTVTSNLITHILVTQVMSQLEKTGGFIEVFTKQKTKATNVFGFDPFTTIPYHSQNTSVTATANEKYYGLYLGGYALLLNSISISMNKSSFDFDVLSLFSEDYIDCQIDNMVNGSTIVNSSILPTTFLLPNEITRFRNNNLRAYQGLNSNLVFEESGLCNSTAVPITNADYVSFGTDGGYDSAVVETTQTGLATDISISANFDRTRLPNGAMAFSIQKSLNPATGEFNEELGIQTIATTAGVEQLNTGFTAFYRTGQLVYTSTGTANDGTLIIHSFAQSGGKFNISYYFSLCLENSDCSVPSNVRYFYGNMIASLDADIAFQSTGTLQSPISLGAGSYDSLISDDKQLISSTASSYYSISISGNSIFDVSVKNADGKVDLFVYSDSAFTQLLCTDTNIASLDRSCSGVVGVPTTLFIRLNYADLVEGANYDLLVNSGQVSISTNGSVANYYSHVDAPSAQNHATISSIIDYTVQPNKRTNVSVQSNYNTGQAAYLNTLTFSFDTADNIGSFTLGNNASASFVSNNVVYSDADAIANGTITIDYYGASGDVIQGSYSFLLCEVATDCSVLANQISLSGEFIVARDTIIPFLQEGDIVTPLDLISIPYNGMAGNNLHTVVSGFSSYYSITAQASSYYIFEVNTLSDNVALYVYSDANFTNLLCSSDHLGIASERCGLLTTSETALYVRVDYLGVGEGAFYDLNIVKNTVSLSENGNPLTTYYETSQAGLSTDRFISAIYDQTALGGAETQITLKKSYNTGISNYDDILTLSFNGLNVTGTYNINIDASAKYNTASTNYITDGINSNGSIIVDQYDPIGGVIHGNYNITLCVETLDCSINVNQYQVSGSFNVRRDSDIMFLAEGDAITPVVLGTAPYDSTTALPVDQRHLTDFSSSYYSVTVDINSQYHVIVDQPSNDITLTIFSDASFTTQLCYAGSNFGP